MVRISKKSIMKLQNIIITLGLLLIASCKQADYPIENASSYTHIFMQLANNGLYEKSMAITDNWEKIELGVGYGGVEENTSNLEIQLTIDEAAILRYNEQNGTSYEIAPEGSYRLKDNKVFIAPGRSGSNSTQLEVNSSLLNGTHPYLIPISIVNNSANLPVVEGLGTTYFLVSGFYESNPFENYSSEKWTILDYSDDDNEGASGGRARHAIDGKLETFWHSQWRRNPDGSRPNHPHFIAVDMHETNLLHGLTIYGRQGDESKVGYLFPKNVFIEGSVDGENWLTVGNFDMVATNNMATIYFEKNVQVRYFKFTTLSSKGNSDTVSAAEIVAF
ncbi:MAG TPA: hypothetical protein DDZ96_08320 [Porphyromonadaceae bacterium]|jgi:hypothetical protein|nr:hypothetical protein [Porphyromonadaceae bacterium]HBK32709.1 hypothetical protein [Porphyromonadaceae bacterium]HBL33809.1 hypothetical protein [Porphyromonadaceae bacterium]HBX20030.1 hypothetical protein [Porphyromonadaceae bacterium]HCM22399.1 hypothetical protein [Porphyromonadaceae bacterium]